MEGLRFRLVDAQGQVVGRLASQIATILQGKDKPTFKPNADDGDVVVVINCAEVELTGRKWDQKLYRSHSGYPGGLKERTAKEQFARKPDFVLRQAVLGMLPKNNLRRSMARKLRIFPGERHAFEDHPALTLFEMPPRKLRVKGELFDLPQGFEPFNPQAYYKRFGHRLGKQQQQQAAAAGQQQQQQAAAGGES